MTERRALRNRTTAAWARWLAILEVRLLAFAREPFLDAVTGHGTSRLAADELIAGRLGE